MDNGMSEVDYWMAGHLGWDKSFLNFSHWLGNLSSDYGMSVGVNALLLGYYGTEPDYTFNKDRIIKIKRKESFIAYKLEIYLEDGSLHTFYPAASFTYKVPRNKDNCKKLMDKLKDLGYSIE